MAVSAPHVSRGRLRGWFLFLCRFIRLAGPYWSSPARWKVGLLTVTLVGLTAAQVAIAVAFNSWYERLFNALEGRALTRFVMLVGILFLIMLGSAAVTTVHLWIKRRIQVGWREWLTDRLLHEWMTSGRHYQISQVPGDHDNPDGRIAEDVRITTEYATDLAHSLLYCLLLLVSFTQILWTLSGPPEVQLGELALYVPGHMVWVAVLYSAAGSAIALALGWPLVRAANARQSAEANFRFGLVRARENSLAIALQHGEADERRTLRDLFREAVGAWDRQTFALARLLFFSSNWTILSQVFPILVSAPRYIAGAITLGVLMQTAQAFQQMAAALSWPIDNLSKAAEWRASVERVERLHEAIRRTTHHAVSAGQSTIAVEPHGQPTLAFVDCAIHDPDGRPVIAPFRAEIRPGERVLISGDTGAAIKLFKAVAGLWPWGRGRIGLPSNGDVYFMPYRPYMPLGTLAEAVCYPTDPQSYDEERIHTALKRAGLEELIPQLGERRAWENSLSIAEQQRLGFARLLLHDPRWIFLEEATGSLDAASEATMMGLLRDGFPDAAVITIDKDRVIGGFHKRHLALVRLDRMTHVTEKPVAPGVS